MFASIKSNQNLSGEIGEIIAKHHILKSVKTSETYVEAFIQKYDYTLKSEEKDFLKNHWKNIDLVRINHKQELEIFEIKSKKYFYGKLKLPFLFHKDKITKYSLEAYQKAKDLGIKTYLVQITLFENWRYGLLIKDFNFKNIWIDKRDKLFNKSRL